MSRPSDVEILPPDPDWEPPRPVHEVVYEVEPPPPGVVSDVKEARAPNQPSSFRDAKTGARVAGDPRVVARLFRLSFRLAAVLAVVVFLVWALQPLGPDTLPVIAGWLRSQPVLGRVLVMLAVAAGVPFFAPVGPLALIPGYLWGTWQGLLLTLTGAVLGGLVNLNLSRRFLGPDVLAWTRSQTLANAIYKTIDARGLRVILGLRLSPLMPFGLLAYLSGLVSVRQWQWAIAVFIGGAPWTAVYAILGSLLAESNRDLDLNAGKGDPMATWLMWFGLAVTIFLAIWIGRLARREILGQRQRDAGRGDA